jgi:hypothetical protein
MQSCTNKIGVKSSWASGEVCQWFPSVGLRAKALPADQKIDLVSHNLVAHNAVDLKVVGFLIFCTTVGGIILSLVGNSFALSY